jgi:hypothetical protein
VQQGFQDVVSGGAAPGAQVRQKVGDGPQGRFYGGLALGDARL